MAKLNIFYISKLPGGYCLADREILKWENGLWGDAKSILGASRDLEEVETKYKRKDSVFINSFEQARALPGEVLEFFFLKYLIN